MAVQEPDIVKVEEIYVDPVMSDSEQRYVQLIDAVPARVNGTASSSMSCDPPKLPIRTSSVRPDNKMTTTNIYSRLKQHKLTLIAFLCGLILALIILIPITVTRSCENDETVYKFKLRYDRSSIHPSLFISDDNAVLSNVFTRETPISVRNSEQFQTYKGVKGDRCFTRDDKIYFQIEFYFALNMPLSSNSSSLVVEIGLVDEDKVDNEFYVGAGDGWSYHIHSCVNKICLSAQRYSKGIDEDIKTISQTNDIGTLEMGNLGFFVNMKRNEFSIIDHETMKILYTFDKVTAPDTLCPVFGVYNPHSMEVKMEVMDAYDFSTLPIVNVIA